MHQHKQCYAFGLIGQGCPSRQQMKIWGIRSAAMLISAVMLSGIVGCTVTGEPVMYEFDGAEHRFEARVNGMNLTATVFLDGQAIISHSWPPFVNSRDEQMTHVGSHEVRSVLRIIKGIGNTTVQIYVYMDSKQVGAFYF